MTKGEVESLKEWQGSVTALVRENMEDVSAVPTKSRGRVIIHGKEGVEGDIEELLKGNGVPFTVRRSRFVKRRNPYWEVILTQ